ncbi:MAG: aldehyde dehydrogenase family protein [Pseudonocardiaceae bacterium]
MRRTTPAPRCGELVRRLGELIREHHCDLADLITTEVGKICSEALGEVQEMIDICEFAVSLASARLLARADEDVGGPVDVHRLLLAARAIGQQVVDDPRVALVSATGSTRMGREVACRVAARFGRTLLELWGQQRHRDRVLGRLGPRHEWHRVLRRGYCRTAVYHATQAHRAQRCRRCPG